MTWFGDAVSALWRFLRKPSSLPAIIALGVMLLLRTSWAWTAWFGWAAGGFIWPAILIAIGAWVIYRAQNRT